MLRLMILVATVLLPVTALRAQTLLEDVLYVVSTYEAKNNEDVEVTVRQNRRQLSAEQVIKSPGSRYRIEIKQIDQCKFSVDHQLGIFSARFEIDFGPAQLDDARKAEVLNQFGRRNVGVTIPGAHYCLFAGRPYYNAIPIGQCRPTFDVETVAARRPEDFDKMLSRIKRLRVCRPAVS